MAAQMPTKRFYLQSVHLQNECASKKGVPTGNTNFHDGDVNMPAYIQMYVYIDIIYIALPGRC